MYAFYEILDAFNKAGIRIYETFTGLWGLMNTPLSEYINLFEIPIPKWIVDTLTIGLLSYTPLELMIGAGLTFFIGFTVIKWILDIVL